MLNNVQLAITAFGAPEMLKLQRSNIPTPSADQVLIKISYTGVNPIDAKTRAGLGWAAEQNKDKLPWVPGYDIAGIVDMDCENTVFKKGDRVVGLLGFPLEGGGYSQYITANMDDLSLVPNGVSLTQAASLPIPGSTALQALDKISLNANDTVLILAGAGGVGHLAIQLANDVGAKVYASCSSANISFISELGATALDYSLSPLDTQVQNVDVLIDLMGGDVGEAALNCVAKGGRVVTIPTLTAQRIIDAAAKKGIVAQGMLVSPNTEQLNKLLTMVKNNVLRVEISKIYSLEQGVQAHEDIQTGRTRGKILLEMPT